MSSWHCRNLRRWYPCRSFHRRLLHWVGLVGVRFCSIRWHLGYVKLHTGFFQCARNCPSQQEDNPVTSSSPSYGGTFTFVVVLYEDGQIGWTGQWTGNSSRSWWMARMRQGRMLRMMQVLDVESGRCCRGWECRLRGKLPSSSLRGDSDRRSSRITLQHDDWIQKQFYIAVSSIMSGKHGRSDTNNIFFLESPWYSYSLWPRSSML